ncbi:MAG TPA: hypothetical protein DCS67_05995, partial [Clostridiales bacterium UBA8960]|nr:hypothetical protein [Clostridiales bacterium UBA8960]
MNLSILKRLLSKREARFVIGRLHENGKTNCEIVGVSRSKDKLTLLAVHSEPEEQRNVDDEKDERPRLTNRFIMRDHGKHEHGWPLQHVGKVTIDGVAFEVRGQECRRISGYEWESVIELYEFMKAGWTAERFEDVYGEQLVLTRLKLEGEDARIIKPNANSEILFEKRPHVISYSVGKPLTLEIGENYPDKLWFEHKDSEERIWVQINRVHLMDIYEELLKAFDEPQAAESISADKIEEMKSELEMRLGEICPRGMFLPVVEYECDEDISLQFFAQSFLDETPRNSGAIGFIMGADKETGKLGSKLKSCVIQTAVTGDTRTLEVELFGY